MNQSGNKKTFLALASQKIRPRANQGNKKGFITLGNHKIRPLANQDTGGDS